MFFINWRKKSFGLDISEKVFRIVQLSKYGSKIKLISYHSINIPQGILKDGKIVSQDKAISLINQLIHGAKGKKIFTRFVTACLAETKTFIKLINLEEKDNKNKDKDIVPEIIEESKKHIPYPLEDVYLDWQYSGDQKQVLIGVCPKEIVENYQEVLIKAGLIPLALEIEAAAIVRSIFPVKENIKKPVMILDLGANRSGFIVYLNSTIPFTLSLTFSGDFLTQELMKKLKINVEEAEKAKCLIGLDKSKAQSYVYQILAPLFKQLCQKIREAKYFYHEHFYGQGDITKLYLTGGVSMIPGGAEFLAREIDMEVKLADPLVNLSSGGLTIPKENIQSYTTAIGLALRNLYLTD
ncbi:type IV pilus assembly protein PilM [Patescibacteria group bacterium]|nr:type IV pilus assembly protein PilM [Patescibacteria group bacterium]